MDYTNAFVGSNTAPTRPEVAAALGPVASIWDDFIAWMASEKLVTDQEWKGIAVKKYGWSLRLRQKGRNIVYLGPGTGCFLVGFVLGGKAMIAAKQARVPKPVREVIATAPRYPEGYGLRLVVRTKRDLPAIRAIAAIKLEH
ncbi:MAG: DUF3788 family protein [Terracidiphilus sp.]|nr:DUF3788 family protein [Terracidiphilus sp.]